MTSTVSESPRNLHQRLVKAQLMLEPLTKTGKDSRNNKAVSIGDVEKIVSKALVNHGVITRWADASPPGSHVEKGKNGEYLVWTRHMQVTLVNADDPNDTVTDEWTDMGTSVMAAASFCRKGYYKALFHLVDDTEEGSDNRSAGSGESAPATSVLVPFVHAMNEAKTIEHLNMIGQTILLAEFNEDDRLILRTKRKARKQAILDAAQPAQNESETTDAEAVESDTAGESGVVIEPDADEPSSEPDAPPELPIPQVTIIPEETAPESKPLDKAAPKIEVLRVLDGIKPLALDATSDDVEQRLDLYYEAAKLAEDRTDFKILSNAVKEESQEFKSNKRLRDFYNARKLELGIGKS